MFEPLEGRLLLSGTWFTENADLNVQSVTLPDAAPISAVFELGYSTNGAILTNTLPRWSPMNNAGYARFAQNHVGIGTAKVTALWIACEEELTLS